MEFVRKILSLADEFDFSVTSWKRTAKRNTQVGGKLNSKHLSWFAVDIVLDNTEDRAKCYKAIKVLSLKFLDEGDHIHVQI